MYNSGAGWKFILRRRILVIPSGTERSLCKRSSLEFAKVLFDMITLNPYRGQVYIKHVNLFLATTPLTCVWYYEAPL